MVTELDLPPAAIAKYNAIKQAVIRDQCEQSFEFFARYFFKVRKGSKFILNDHHLHLIGLMEEMHKGVTTNAIVNMPPRYSKTELCVVLFVAWCFAKNPASEFIHLSYSEPLATENSAAAREVIRSAEFQELWPLELVAHKNGKGAWATKQGGSFYATSTGGQVTGFGAGRLDEWDGHVFRFSGMLLIDDPLKPDEARHNPLRTASNRRWTETIQSRRNSPRTPTLCIMQRIHEDDFTSMLLADGPFTAERFRHVVMPAILDEGLPTERALWPAKHSLPMLLSMRDQKNARGETNPLAGETFSGQYQQRPTKVGGSIVRLPWWEHYYDRAEVLKVITHQIITCDTAYTADTANDPHSFQVWGFEGKKRMYLLDRAHGWWEFDDAVKHLRDLAAKWPKAKRIYIEAKASGLSLAQTYRKTTKRQVIPWKPKDYHWPDDKVGRMMQWARQVHGSAVWIPSEFTEEPSYQPWVKAFKAEHAAFNADDTHAHDDDCDAANMAGSVWVRMGGGVRDALTTAAAEEPAPVE